MDTDSRPISKSVALQGKKQAPKPIARGAGHQGPLPQGQRPVRPQTKYPKICPAIAPKPIAMAASMPKIPFSPTISKLVSLLLLDQLNTSKRWVLPPRPRPGRKPTDEKAAVKMLPKKRAKVKKEVEEEKKPIKVTTSPPPPCDLQVAVTSITQGPSSLEVMELKMAYLAKLKEQELIRNYIEVITNQINELSFVKLGVINCDALRTPPALGVATPTKSPPAPSEAAVAARQVDSLSQIKNPQDLNKFLNYLNKLSTILNLATKRPQKPGTSELWVNSQLNHYLDLRLKFQAKTSPTPPQATKMLRVSKSFSGVLLPQLEVLTPPLTTMHNLVTQLPRFLDDFDFDLSNPLGDIDLILDNDVVDQMIMDAPPDINEIGQFLVEEELGTKITLDSSRDEEETIRLVKMKRASCGLCSAELPCLCLEPDIDRHE